jgi:hypothetical protein
LPLLLDELKEKKLLNPETVIAALATVGVECHFRPVQEAFWLSPKARSAYLKRYEYYTKKGKELGNIKPGDGERYCGRGYIQLTGRSNYTHYGKVLKVDLVNHPELALQPDIAAKILVQYFIERHVDQKAQAKNWKAVRRAVNGKLKHYTDFHQYVMNMYK